MSKQPKATHAELLASWEEALTEATREALGASGSAADVVREILARKREEIVVKLLGFDSRWGEWDLDHCNGRSGDSAAGDYLRSRAGQAVKAWLDEQAGDLPELPKRAIDSLRREYLAAYESELGRALRQLAQSRAREDVQSVADRVVVPAPRVDSDEGGR